MALPHSLGSTDLGAEETASYVEGLRLLPPKLKRSFIIKNTSSKPDASDIRVLKTATCPSLSGKSKLTYEIGCDPSAELHIRITKNTGTGWFSSVWVALSRVHELFARNGDAPITFSTLLPLFEGSSVNTAGFLLAALKHEGLVQQIPDKTRQYERLEAKAFFSEIEALMGAALPGKTKAPQAVKPRAAKAVAVKR